MATTSSSATKACATTDTDDQRRRVEPARCLRPRSFFRRYAAALAMIAAAACPPAFAQDALLPGEAVVTGFAGTIEDGGRLIIDPDGAVAAVLDLRRPGASPQGARWPEEARRALASAGEIGQVFGIAIDDATPPNIYLTATSAFGLHRNANNSGWMEGMWGADGGPGAVWRLDAADGYRPRLFARVSLDGRDNTGAALGNIAFDARNRQLFVSDLETGMIHRLALADGTDLDTYDHGEAGRTRFLDAVSREFRALPAVAFDPATGARVDDCPSGDFSRTPSCWNLADFRRRVWGLALRDDPATGEARLYYAVWSSQGFGHADFATADEEDRRNSVWSVGIGPDGGFAAGSVRREFLLPDFFRSPEAIARAGRSHPVADIAFPAIGAQDVMLLAERGGLRNLGLAADNAFATPNEARVLRYELGETGLWRAAGRYDVGYYDRGEDGPPYLRAGAAGGVSFGPGFSESGDADQAQPDGFVWMTGDGLCSPRGACFEPAAGDRSDTSQVSGLQGRAERPYEAFEPITAFQPYPAPGPMTPPAGPDASYMVDADADAGRNDATRIGDVAVFQPLPGAGEPPLAVDDEIAGWPEGLPPEGWLPAPPPDDGWFLPPPFPIDTDLAIRKSGPADCQEGVECTYTITLRNVGAVTYIGPLAIEDDMPAGATLASTSPGWNCAPVGAGFRCITNAHALLVPGATAAIQVDILLPADVPGATVRNCVAIDWFEMGTDDGPGDGNDEDCVDTPVTEGFDLGLAKTGPVDCAENATCAFGIELANHGPGEFQGTLAIRDQLPAGSEIVGSTAGWTCLQTADEVECHSAGDLTLPALATEAIGLIVKLPDGIAPAMVQNCAEINWSAMGADDGTPDPHADDDCHTVNVIDGAGFYDLFVTKAGPASCNSGANCEYAITITNDGPGDYNGTLVLQDTPPAGFTYVSGSAGWTCVPGPIIGCTLDAGVVLLHPGDSRSLTLTLAVPPGASADLNCVNVAWGWGGMPPDDVLPPGGIDLPDEACSLTQIDAGFDISLAKSGPAECYEGGACAFTVDVTNNGPGLSVGIIAFDDILPAGATLESVEGAWTCAEGVPGTVTCNMPAFFWMPGATNPVTYNLRLPDPVVGPSVENCVVMNWGAVPAGMFAATFTGDDDPATDGPACATVPVLAADLAPWGATTCELGSACPIDVKVENRGGRTFKGAAGLRGTLDPGVTISSIESRTAGFACRVTGPGTYECDGDDVTIKAGAAADIAMVLQIPETFPHRRIVHRKEMLWPDARVKDRKPQNDRHVSTIMIRQPEEPAPAEQPAPPPPETTPVAPPPPDRIAAADIALTKSAARDACTAGAPCDFTITATNVGRATYAGPLVISDAIAPGGARIAGFGPSPWSCRESRGEFVCSHRATSLAPGESRTLSLSLDTRRDSAGTARNCARLEWNERTRVMAAQGALNALGFDAGPVDGQPGRRTRAAVEDFQRSAGLRVDGRIDGALLDRLFDAWGDGDANAANDGSCTSVVLQRPLEPPPVCPRGEVEVDRNRIDALRADGWRIAPVTRAGRTIYCGVPPAPLACPAGYREYANPSQVPPGSDVIRERRGNQVIYCARPPRLSCPPGYDTYSSRNRVPRGWEIRTLREGGEVLYCARPPQLSCPRGFESFASRNRIPQGWETRTIREGRQVLYCARPPRESCPRGWDQVDPARAAVLALQGWQIRNVGRIICARRPQQTQPPAAQTPECTGGRVWDAKRRTCVCPGGTVWNRRQNRCIQPQIRQPGQTQTPQPTVPPGLRLIVPPNLQ